MSTRPRPKSKSKKKKKHSSNQSQPPTEYIDRNSLKKYKRYNHISHYVSFPIITAHKVMKPHDAHVLQQCTIEIFETGMFETSMCERKLLKNFHGPHNLCEIAGETTYKQKLIRQLKDAYNSSDDMSDKYYQMQRDFINFLCNNLAWSEFRGVVQDVHFGFEDWRGTFMQNVPDRICIAYPQIYDPVHKEWIVIDSHLWLFFNHAICNQMYSDSKILSGLGLFNNEPIDIHIGETLRFVGNISTYKTEGIIRQGIEFWSPIESNLVYQYKDKRYKVPKFMKLKCKVFSYDPDRPYQTYGYNALALDCLKGHYREDLEYLESISDSFVGHFD